METVVFPSPAGVGEMAETRISFDFEISLSLKFQILLRDTYLFRNFHNGKKLAFLCYLNVALHNVIGFSWQR